MQSAASGPSRLFTYLAATCALLTIGLIVFGAVVRVTDSGLGCGNEWPTCHGSLIPPIGNVTAWIEWLHRAFAVLIGLFGLATLAVAIRAFAKRNRVVLVATAFAALLFALQSALGALVVVLDLPPTAVTLHLGTAMLLLASLLVAAIASAYRPRDRYARDSFTTLVVLTAALSLVIILSGALMRGAGATLACADWPLCNGSLLPFDQGPLQIIHWLHRASVLGLGIALALLAWQAWIHRKSRMIQMLASAAVLLYLGQAGVGALFVWSGAAPEWGATHVGLAAATWAALIALAAIEMLNTSNSQARVEWKLQSSAAAD
jgi:heme A synthase